jgi:hypothetical protein
MKTLLLLLIFQIQSPHLHAQGINPFSSDGCTLAPDGTFSRPSLWQECCIVHDLWYWGGGSKNLRSAVDKNLKSCIEAKAGALVANLFSLGVEIGSYSPFKLKNKKWGNAWSLSSKPVYQDLNLDQKKKLLIYLEGYSKFPALIQPYKDYLATEANSSLH